MDSRDNAVSRNGHLGPQQAASLLGCSPRTVRRAIEQGRLAGTLHPCRTTKEACDAYRQRQQSMAGEVVAGRDTAQGARDTRVTAPPESEREVLLYALREIESLALALGRRESEAERLEMELRRQEAVVMDLCREVGRLEAQAAQGHNGQNGQPKGQRASALGRLGPWLRG